MPPKKKKGKKGRKSTQDLKPHLQPPPHEESVNQSSSGLPPSFSSSSLEEVHESVSLRAPATDHVEESDLDPKQQSQESNADASTKTKSENTHTVKSIPETTISSRIEEQVIPVNDSIELSIGERGPKADSVPNDEPLPESNSYRVNDPNQSHGIVVLDSIADAVQKELIIPGQRIDEPIPWQSEPQHAVISDPQSPPPEIPEFLEPYREITTETQHSSSLEELSSSPAVQGTHYLSTRDDHIHDGDEISGRIVELMMEASTESFTSRTIIPTSAASRRMSRLELLEPDSESDSLVDVANVDLVLDDMDAVPTEPSAPSPVSISTANRFQQSLSFEHFETSFRQLCIPEMELLEVSNDHLETVILSLHTLRQELDLFIQREQHSSNDAALITGKYVTLLERIGREIDLYQQFSKLNQAESSGDGRKKTVMFDELVKEPLETLDEMERQLGSDVMLRATKSLNDLKSLMSLSTTSLSSTATKLLPPKKSMIDLRSASFTRMMVPPVKHFKGPQTMTTTQSQTPSLFSSDLLSREDYYRVNTADSQSGTGYDEFGEEINDFGAGALDMLKWTNLTTLSTPLFSKAYEREYGVPTVMTVRGGVLVGTSKSVVLVFSFSQTLKGILGLVANASNYGSATTIEVSPDHRYLVAGFSKGVVTIWDLERRRMLKCLSPISLTEQASGKVDGHVFGMTVCRVGFLSVSTSKVELFSADVHGNAFCHKVRLGLIMTSVESVRVHGKRAISDAPVPPTTTIYGMACLSSLHPAGRNSSTNEKTNIPQYPGDQNQLIALVTPFKLAVIAMKPEPVMVHKIMWKSIYGDNNFEKRFQPALGACVAWWAPVASQASVKEPFLAFSFENSLGVLQVSYQSSSSGSSPQKNRKLTFRLLTTRRLLISIVYLGWITEKLLYALTSEQEIVFFDPTTLLEIERMSIADRNNRSLNFYSSLSTEAFPSYLGSICEYRCRVFTLGKQHISSASLFQWKDRLGRFIRAGYFSKAFFAAVSLYQGRFKIATLGLNESFEENQRMIRDHVSVLLQSYLAMSLSNFDPETDTNHQQYVQLATTIAETCVQVDLTGLFFSEVYDRFLETGLEAVYVEALEPFFLNESLQQIPNPLVIQSLLRHYESQGWLDRLEQIVLHLDPVGLDIHQMIQICKQYGLYTALFYVYTRAVEDYVTPLLDVLHMIDSSLHSDKEDTITTLIPRKEHLYILYAYLSLLLSQKSFPYGQDLPEKNGSRITGDVYSFLFSPRFLKSPLDSSRRTDSTPNLSLRNVSRFGLPPRTTPAPIVDIDTRTTQWNSTAEPYPYIRILLLHAADSFLNAIAAGFEGSAWKDTQFPLNTRLFLYDHELDRHAEQLVSLGHGMSRQFIMQALWDLWDESVTGETGLFSWSVEISVSLGCFLGRQYGKFRRYIIIDGQRLDDLFSYLVQIDHPTTIENRQIALLSILSTGFEPSGLSIPSAFESHALWKVYEYHVEKNQQYDLIIGAYLCDTERRLQVFDAIDRLLEANGSLNFHHLMRLKQKIVEQIADLVELNEVRTAELVSRYWPSEKFDLVQKLESQPQLQMKLLRGYHAMSQGGEVRRSTLLDKRSTKSETQGKNVDTLIPLLSSSLPVQITSLPDLANSAGPVNTRVSDDSRRPISMISTNATLEVSSLPMYDKSVLMTTALYDLYVKRLAEYEPTQLVPFFESFQKKGVSFPFGIEGAIQICLDKNIHDAAVWMLEQIGSKRQALELLVSAIPSTFARDIETFISPSFATLSCLTMPLVAKAVRLCEQNGFDVSDEESEEPWHILFDVVYFDILAKIPSDSDMAIRTNIIETLHKPLASLVLDGVVSHIKLSTLLSWIIRRQSGATVGQHRNLIQAMLESHKYQAQLLQTAHIIESETGFQELVENYKLRKRAYRPTQGQCRSCRRLLHIRAMLASEKEERIVFLRCSHAYHLACLEKELQTMMTETMMRSGEESSTGSPSAPSSPSSSGGTSLAMYCPSCHSEPVSEWKSFWKAKGKLKSFISSAFNLSNGGESASTTDSLHERLHSYLYDWKPHLIDTYHRLGESIPSYGYDNSYKDDIIQL